MADFDTLALSQEARRVATQQAMAEAGVLKASFDEFERREAVAKQRFLDTIGEYERSLQQLSERHTVRELEDKDKMAALELENKRLKAFEEGVEELQLRFLESKILLQKFHENEEKLIEELKKKNRDLLEARAQYEALVTHAKSKLQEAQSQIQKANEASQQEVNILKAKIFRHQSSSQSLQQALESREKENKNLHQICQNLLSKLETGDRTDLESIKTQLYHK
eukprot:TRINITY_DN13980_c0_g1_i1.p1 TRINITY_DN13980_c0_g1~~TRINITY_DN13980_c0_g1_i1.p1  ORF type:complete len:243 (+),score=66.22 TRINITY_DN13980_c0_g1_i1:59-730(+)